MKYLILILFLALSCTPNQVPFSVLTNEVCNYESEHPMVAEINWVMIDSIRLDTVEYFTFPYELEGNGLEWQVSQDSVFNYGRLQKHLNNYLSIGSSEVYVDGAGNVIFNLIGVENFNHEPIWNGTFEGYATDVDFIKTCY